MQAVTATGRLSSNKPNLQNIPIRTEIGKKIRTAFIAEKDHELYSFDYSQIELRVLCEACEDPNLLKAFQEDQDIHESTGQLVFNKKNNLVEFNSKIKNNILEKARVLKIASEQEKNKKK